MKKFIEPLLGSLGILIAGIITIPFAGYLSGVSIDAAAALKMSIYFFIGRFIWLYILRHFFSKERND